MHSARCLKMNDLEFSLSVKGLKMAKNSPKKTPKFQNKNASQLDYIYHTL